MAKNIRRVNLDKLKQADNHINQAGAIINEVMKPYFEYYPQWEQVTDAVLHALTMAKQGTEALLESI